MFDIIKRFSEINKDSIAIAGGKGANLGELQSIAGVPVPPGFIITTNAYQYFIEENGLRGKLNLLIKGLDINNLDKLNESSEQIRKLFHKGKIPLKMKEMIIEEYNKLRRANDEKYPLVAVRSSATAEDLSTASFAGQQDTYLNVSNPEDLFEKVKLCWASLYTPRVISYRERNKVDHNSVKLAVVIQEMVNSELSGIMFTRDPMTNENRILIEGGYGLGQAFVSGEVTPDTYIVDKTNFKIIDKKIAKQTWKYVRGSSGECKKVDVPLESQTKMKLTEEQIKTLAKYGSDIERHYDHPMDIEWCFENGRFYIVQARPITTLASETSTASLGVVPLSLKDSTSDTSTSDTSTSDTSTSDSQPASSEKIVILKGLSASPGIATGKVKLIKEIHELSKVLPGDILVTEMTTPDMVPAMTIASAIVTDTGGMTCHAAIVSRELGIPCIVGTEKATQLLKDGDIITIDGKLGVVYKGDVTEKEKEAKSALPSTTLSVPVTGTKVLVNVGVPQKAKEYAQLPVSGVGLMRLEFIFTSYVREHPLYLIELGQQNKLLEKLVEGIAEVARAFFPRPIILRFSDFKTNEYRDMIGGEKYEPVEQNPMIGWRGCSRYISQEYREGFKIELLAVKKVRTELGLKNVHVMLPFPRMVEEIREIIQMMESVGLKRSKDFKLYLMAEVPVNIFLADEFAKYCDGFSIGSNDLTQLIMGADRDSDILTKMGYFDERNAAVKRAISHLIKVAHEHGCTVGICGQAPSIYPEFTEFLVREGIDSISLNADTVIDTIRLIASIEQKVLLERSTGKTSDE